MAILKKTRDVRGEMGGRGVRDGVRKEEKKKETKNRQTGIKRK